MTAEIIGFKTQVKPKEMEPKCSFCAKTKREVKSLVANADNSRHICDQCTTHCMALINQSN